MTLRPLATKADNPLDRFDRDIELHRRQKMRKAELIAELTDLDEKERVVRSTLARLVGTYNGYHKYPLDRAKALDDGVKRAMRILFPKSKRRDNK